MRYEPNKIDKPFVAYRVDDLEDRVSELEEDANTLIGCNLDMIHNIRSLSRRLSIAERTVSVLTAVIIGWFIGVIVFCTLKFAGAF